jgi:cyclophilin family peptidyl-prolyl cis-trans isomerase
MRKTPRLLALLLVLSSAAAAQAPTRADSGLIYEILTAEERRDGRHPALAAGEVHTDARIRHLARRARARIADSTFAQRDSLGMPDARAVPSWPVPEWDARYRALSQRTGTCENSFQALNDSVMHVRLRAISVAGNHETCRTHGPMRAALRRLIDAMPADASGRRWPNGSWHEGAAALMSFALIAPDSATPMILRYAIHTTPQVRRAAARASVATKNTLVLRRLARDVDANVSEAAITGLSRVAGHEFDTLYLARVSSAQPQVALAAATALKGSTHAALTTTVREALASYNQRAWASERDVREALRGLLGDSAREPWKLWMETELPQRAVALALGERVFLEVELVARHGGRRFTVELRGDVAPIMAARMLTVAESDAYEGMQWHRVEPVFVLQGGGALGNEYSGAGAFLVDELGTIAHPRGSVGMSTRGHDTGDEQWFINVRDNRRLVGDYTVWAMVVDGMDVVDRILEGDEVASIRVVSDPRSRARP